MVWSVAKAKTPRSAPGSESAGRAAGVKPKSYGFTLIELLVVVVLIAIASTVASLALRDPAATALEQDAARLAALLESARAEARASGLAVHWEPKPAAGQTQGFRFLGLSPATVFPTLWLASDMSAEVVGAPSVVLGPEPLIGAQRIVLRLNERQLSLATDGLGPFVVLPDDTPAQAR